MPDTAQVTSRNELLARLPAPWPKDPLPEIRRHLEENRRSVVVLDDDPTGTQTVQDVPVLTGWAVSQLEQEFAARSPLFYILTNSRSMPDAEAAQVGREIIGNLIEASGRTQRNFVVISRSDSTLRGHFPLEIDLLAETDWGQGAPWIVAPFFEAGGRITVNDVHYVTDGEQLVPAHMTPFAKDKVFGFRTSNLCEWIKEKTGGCIPAGEIVSISLDTLRSEGPDAVAHQLATLQDGSVCIVNAMVQRDLEVFVQGLLQVEATGRRFLYRTAASFVAARAGMAIPTLLQGEDLPMVSGSGGLFVVGSYVPKSSAQLAELLNEPAIKGIEVNVVHLLKPEEREAEIERVIKATEACLQNGDDTVLYTSRRLQTGDSATANLEIGQLVASALVRVVQAISVRPRYLVAKGGITSSDLATKALGVKRAKVSGQILPGVPVWITGDECRWSGLTYVVFPGNVGERSALRDLARLLADSANFCNSKS